MKLQKKMKKGNVKNGKQQFKENERRKKQNCKLKMCKLTRLENALKTFPWRKANFIIRRPVWLEMINQ